MNKLLISGVAVAALAGLAPALAQTAAPPAAAAKTMKPGKQMTRADMVQRAQQHFARLDANRDGFVTQAEAQAARAQFGERMAKRGGARFDRLDSNKDGAITRAEVDAALAARQQRASEKGTAHSSRWDRLAARLDTNKDGLITRAEFDSMHAARGQRHAQRAGNPGKAGAGHLFLSADADKDGRVSMAEATAAAAAHFDRADANRDGTITRDERRSARKAMRGNAGGR